MKKLCANCNTERQKKYKKVVLSDELKDWNDFLPHLKSL
jgi:hypothetical protein